MNKKLKRSSSDRVLAGVCGGIGEYFNVDPVIIRILWVLITFMPGGPGLIAYIVCALIIPEDTGVIYQDSDDSSSSNTRNTPIFIGIALVVVGGYMLARLILPQHIFQFFNIFRYWPVLLILAGIYIIINNKR
ncbi:PspC domain-containing protein [Schnuerera sp.]|uniref:PspC domain-containing protein n=1 Tax=Schnuerera sp. TaxID=2794844 RepID=UPI002CA7F515|nr:PspC domain-containing protein [Schnuerera sp.]HSH35642.1 PspC domain-containing protein [Schnuerera sp.]